MRRAVLVLLLVSVFFCGSAWAQTITDDDSPSGILNRAFKNAAEKQNRLDWPIKSLGRPGTAVRLTFDPQNADVTIITDRRYGTAHLLQTEQKLAKDLDLPNADYIRDPETDSAVNVDLDVSKYLSHPRQRVSTFNLDLSRLSALLEATDLPKPIVLGIRANHSRLNTAQLVSPARTRTLTGIVFLGASEIGPDTHLAWSAEVFRSGYVLAAVLAMLMLWPPLLFLMQASKRPRQASAPSTLDPSEVQKRYDRSPPMLIFMVGSPIVIGILVATGIVTKAMESMEFLFPVLVIPVALLAMVGLMVVTMGISYFTRRQRERNGDVPAPNPDDPPSWTRTAFLTPMPFILFLCMGFVILPHVFMAPFRSLPASWRSSATVWLPITFVLVALTPSAIMARLARAKVERRLGPGDIWYERVMKLAGDAGVRVKRVIEIWDSKPNASASLFGSVRLTRGLLHKLDADEVDAVIAHELGHHIGGHPRKTFVLTLAATTVLIGLWWALTEFVGSRFPANADLLVVLRAPLFGIFVLPVIVRALVGRGQRERELAADRFAVDVTHDAELVVRTLIKIHDLNAFPRRLKTADEAIHSHPSLDNRIASIREYAAGKYSRGDASNR